MCWWRPIARCTAPRPWDAIRLPQEQRDVTPSNPAETPGGAAERDALPLTLAGQTPDPWGVNRAENLIAGLTGTLSARVVVTPLGEVTEIDVIPRTDTQPKPVVRKI